MRPAEESTACIRISAVLVEIHLSTAVSAVNHQVQRPLVVLVLRNPFSTLPDFLDNLECFLIDDRLMSVLDNNPVLTVIPNLLMGNIRCGRGFQ